MRSINRKEVHSHFPSWMLHDVTEGWVSHMANIDDQCVEVDKSTGPVFDWVYVPSCFPPKPHD